MGRTGIVIYILDKENEVHRSYDSPKVTQNLDLGLSGPVYIVLHFTILFHRTFSQTRYPFLKKG